MVRHPLSQGTTYGLLTTSNESTGLAVNGDGNGCGGDDEVSVRCLKSMSFRQTGGGRHPPIKDRGGIGRLLLDVKSFEGSLSLGVVLNSSRQEPVENRRVSP